MLEALIEVDKVVEMEVEMDRLGNDGKYGVNIG